MATDKAPRVFISYAWEDDAFKQWILRLAETLDRDGILVRLDQRHCEPTQPFPQFMASEIRHADLVLVVGSPQYRIKVHSTEDQLISTGVGYESILLASHWSQGNLQKVITAIGRGTRAESLPDFLVTLPAFDLSDPDDRREYDKLVEYLHAKRPDANLKSSPSGFRSGPLPLWDRGLRFTFLYALRDYIENRWPDLGGKAIYPSLREFAHGIVAVPESIYKKINQNLDANHVALILGATGTGKSVAAAAIAYRWSRQSGRFSYWLDCSEFQLVSESIIRGEIASVLGDGGSNFVVLDNAHNAPEFARWVVAQYRQHNSSGNRLLVLSCPLPAHAAATEASFVSLLDACTVHTDSTPELLRCTALRLACRAGLANQEWHAAEFERWHQEFGGDVVAFALAMTQAGRGDPQARSVTGYVRSTYIDRFRKVDGGLAALSRLASASMIDITLDDAGLGEHGVSAADLLLRDGLLRTFERSGSRRWGFSHTGLGRLIANTLAMDKGSQLEALCADALLDAIHDSPRLLGPLLIRLDPKNELFPVRKFVLKRLTQDKSLMPFMVEQPLVALAAHRHFPELFPWAQALGDEGTMTATLTSLVDQQLQGVVAFIRGIRQFSRTASDHWFDSLLSMNEFRGSLETRPPDEIAALLTFCEVSKPDLVTEIIGNLLLSKVFMQRSSQAFPHQVGSLAMFLDKRVHGSAQVYLSNVMRSESFLSKATESRPDLVAVFIKLALVLLPAEAERLLMELVGNERLFESLVDGPPNLARVFLELAFVRVPEQGAPLLRKFLMDPRTASRASSDRPEEAGQFFVFAHRHEPDLTETVIRALVNRPEFSDTREQLPPILSPSVLRIALRADSAATRACISGIVARENFRHLLCSSPPIHVTRVLHALEIVERSYGELAISWLLQSSSFESVLLESEPEQIATLLKLFASAQAETTARLTSRVLQADLFVKRAAIATPVHVASILRFASRSSRQSVTDFTSRWWARYVDRNRKPDGKTLASCAPMLRIANEFAPVIACEMLEWLRSPGVDFAAAMHGVPREIRLGLVNALAESRKTLAPSQMKALTD